MWEGGDQGINTCMRDQIFNAYMCRGDKGINTCVCEGAHPTHMYILIPHIHRTTIVIDSRISKQNINELKMKLFVV